MLRQQLKINMLDVYVSTGRKVVNSDIEQENK